MENCFVKFKNILRENRRDYESRLNNAIKKYSFAEKDVIRHLNSIVDKKAIIIGGKEVGNIFQIDEKSIDGLSFTNFLQAYKTVKENSYSIQEIQKIINAFDNEKAIDYIENIHLLLSTLITFIRDNYLSDIEATQILGAAISFNYKKARKHKEDYKVKFYSNLTKYFNIDGTFAYTEDLDGLYSNLKALAESDATFVEFEMTYDGYKSDDFFLAIAHLYLDFYRNFQIASIEEHSLERKASFVYSENIRKYYKDGKLIAIPEDTLSFLEELKNSHLSNQEIKYIMSLIEIAKNSAADALNNFYDLEELEFVRNAEKTLENMKPYENGYYEIKKILMELQTLESLFIGSSNKEDVDYILGEKDDFIIRLRELVGPKEDIEPTNIAFLRDIDGETYFSKDLNSIDKGIRNRAIVLLSKINNENKRSFRKVYSSEVNDIEINEVLNRDAHVLFAELPGNIYLVIGTATTGNSYREITNRLANTANRKNIDQIIELIIDDEAKKRYLTEQNALIPSLSEKRVRKQFDN